MRPVGAEQQSLHSDEVGQLAQVLLVVGRDPHVATDRVERVLVEHRRHLVAHLVETLHQQRHPVGAVLDARDAQRGVPVEQAVEHHRPDGVVDRAVRHHELLHCRDPEEGLEALGPTPVLRQHLVAAVAQVERDGDAGLREARPHRVVRGVAEGAAVAAAVGCGRGAHAHHPHAAGDELVDLGERERRIREAHDRRRQDSALTLEAPVVFQPAVERAHARHQRGDVEAQRLLEPTAERGEHEGPFHVLLVEHRDAGGAVLVLRVARLDPDQRLRINALGYLPAEHEVVAARHDHRVERGVRDEAPHLAPGQEEGALALGHHLDAAVLVGRVEVTGAGVERLVVVLVRVDGAEAEVGHRVVPQWSGCRVRKCQTTPAIVRRPVTWDQRPRAGPPPWAGRSTRWGRARARAR